MINLVLEMLFRPRDALDCRLAVSGIDIRTIEVEQRSQADCLVTVFRVVQMQTGDFLGP